MGMNISNWSSAIHIWASCVRCATDISLHMYGEPAELAGDEYKFCVIPKVAISNCLLRKQYIIITISVEKCSSCNVMSS